MVGILCYAVPVMAVEPIVYPANNQTTEQQTSDQEECRQWAAGQSGYDPASVPVQEPAPPAQEKRARDSNLVKGAVAGAAVGGLGGSMGGNFGKGAAAGAAAGLALGAIKDHKEQTQASQTAPPDNQNSERESHYNKAYAACLEGRGYTVK